jgi:hypothetical protein
VGGRVMGGRTGWILVVTNVSLTNDVNRELFPVASSPQMHIRTAPCHQYSTGGRGMDEQVRTRSHDPIPEITRTFDVCRYRRCAVCWVVVD